MSCCFVWDQNKPRILFSHKAGVLTHQRWKLESKPNLRFLSSPNPIRRAISMTLRIYKVDTQGFDI
jgi:hypothetical protein